MNRNEKTTNISEVKEMMENASAIFLTDYSGVNVEDINDLRNQFRNEGVKYKVFKNTLAKRALDESGKYEKLADHLVGMTGFAFAGDNPVVAVHGQCCVVDPRHDKVSRLALRVLAQ